MAIFTPGNGRSVRATRPHSALVRPPVLRVSGDGALDPRSAGADLLFDALAIVGFLQLATELATDHTPAGIALVAALALPFFTGWLAITRVLDRYESDDIPLRLAILGASIATGLMAVQLPFVMHGGGVGFVVGALAVRAIHLWLLRRAQQADAASAEWLRFVSQGTAASMACFALSLLFSGAPQWLLWSTGIACELAWPLRRPKLERAAPAHTSTMGARLGRLVTLLWAGMIVATVLQTARTAWNLEAGIVAVTGFLLIAACWWLYIDPPTAVDVAGLRVLDARRIAAFSLVHGPLVIGIVAIGASVRVLIGSAATGRGDTAARVLLAAASAVVVMTLVFVHRELRDGLRHRVERIRFGVAVMLMLAAIVAMLSRAEFAVFCVAVIVVGLAAWETQEHRIIRRHYVATDDPSLRPMLTPVSVPALAVELGVPLTLTLEPGVDATDSLDRTSDAPVTAAPVSAEQVEGIPDAHHSHPAGG